MTTYNYNPSSVLVSTWQSSAWQHTEIDLLDPVRLVPLIPFPVFPTTQNTLSFIIKRLSLEITHRSVFRKRAYRSGLLILSSL